MKRCVMYDFLDKHGRGACGEHNGLIKLYGRVCRGRKACLGRHSRKSFKKIPVRFLEGLSEGAERTLYQRDLQKILKYLRDGGIGMSDAIG